MLLLLLLVLLFCFYLLLVLVVSQNVACKVQTIFGIVSVLSDFCLATNQNDIM